MSHCNKNISNNIFKYIKGVSKLDISDSNKQFSDKIFDNLSDIHTLIMSNCYFNDCIFANIQRIHTLIMRNNTSITLQAFEHLKNIKILNISNCCKLNNGEVFKYLKGVNILIMHGCAELEITHNNYKYLEGIKYLNKYGHCPFDEVNSIKLAEKINNYKNLYTTTDIKNIMKTSYF